MLTDIQRKQIHDFALTARARLTQEAKELLEGVYGLYPNGTMDPPEKLPQVQREAETRDLYDRLKRFLADEMQAGLPGDEAVSKLLKEVAFTHLNRLVAFKMMEARKLIRGTVDKGVESNGFKFYLAEHPDDYALFQQGQSDDAYRHFLLWQCGQVAQEIKVLFDPHALPGRLFPRPRALAELLALLNAPALAEVWLADETIGWLYQYFNEQEKADVFDRLYKQKQKIRRQDIPAATQLFTPNWIVRYLVQNTLGRLWLQMHPDSQLGHSDLLDYLVPLPGDVPAEALRPVREIKLLDPACGTMHFGLVAFDLLAAMYREELARAGEPGWPATPSVADAADIPAAIIADNLYGIDIDLRAVQLSALALYLKAKSLNKQARITDSNLACADVLPLNGARLGNFIKEMQFTRPVYERLIRALWARLQDVNQLGSLLRLEQELGDLIEAERTRYKELPLFAGVPGEFEQEAAKDEFWDIIYAQVIQGLDEFARQQARAGADQTFFAGEATKGLRLLNLMLSRYDVVVTNPPYSGKSNLNDTVAACLDNDYKDAKGDLYTAFIQRCAEFTRTAGRLGMITQQTFMFLPSYEDLRNNLRAEFAIETMVHTGAWAFVEISGEKVNTTVFILRKEVGSLQRENSIGTYFRLVYAPAGDGKRHVFEHALINGNNVYSVVQRDLFSIPGSPIVYWVSEEIRNLFKNSSFLGQVAPVKEGINTGDNSRFIRFWWEVGLQLIDRKQFVPFAKGAPEQPFFDKTDEILLNDLAQIQLLSGSALRNLDFAFQEAVAFISNSTSGFRARYIPHNYMFCSTGGRAVFPKQADILGILGFLNSTLASYFLSLINPTISFKVGDIAALPFRKGLNDIHLTEIAYQIIQNQLIRVKQDETYTGFTNPVLWLNAIEEQIALHNKVDGIQIHIDDVVFDLYGISKSMRDIIEMDLAGIMIDIKNEELDTEKDVQEPELNNVEDIAIHWISYAIGNVFNRFYAGNPSKLGSAVYRREDFAIGSLPAPSTEEFDELVGPPEQFAYIDAAGGRHVFPAATEQALRALAVPDGITLFDEGHPRDLPTLVDKALRLMLGDTAAQEIITAAAGGDLRKFLEKEFFTQWHLKWYRKRPIYWPLQSAKRSYGFLLFHEKVDKQTLYTLQREYLDAKLRGLRLHLNDLQGQTAGQSGAARKQLERQIDKATQTLNEIEEFARTIERIARAGYEPEPDWIDDGVILRLAPLWELIPLWKTEPKKYWEQLAAGAYDWSHIALRYWPERVREACRTNKSFAIAHGHESWYEG